MLCDAWLLPGCLTVVPSHDSHWFPNSTYPSFIVLRCSQGNTRCLSMFVWSDAAGNSKHKYQLIFFFSLKIAFALDKSCVYGLEWMLESFNVIQLICEVLATFEPLLKVSSRADSQTFCTG